MNLQDYQETVRKTEEYEALADKLAAIWREINNTPSPNHGYIEVREMGEDSITFYWYQHGNFGAEWDDTFSLPASLMFEPEEQQRAFIQAQKEEEDRKEAARKAAEAEKYRQRKIAEARRMLKEAGVEE